MSIRTLLQSFALVAIGACSSDATPVYDDAGQTFDAGQGLDAGQRLDAGHLPDSGSASGCHGLDTLGPGPCGCDADCQPGAICASESEYGFPAGLCLVACDVAETPPAGTHCTELSVGSGALFESCDAAQRCRAGYVCRGTSAAAPHTCDALCSDDSQCPATGHCNLDTGYCQPPTTGLGLNQVCVDDAQCRSGTCFPTSGATPSFCFTRCDVLHPVCPDGGRCVTISSDPAYTAGTCFRACGAGGTCPSGFACNADDACIPTF